jgi:hypothetical protein
VREFEETGVAQGEGKLETHRRFFTSGIVSVNKKKSLLYNDRIN